MSNFTEKTNGGDSSNGNFNARRSPSLRRLSPHRRSRSLSKHNSKPSKLSRSKSRTRTRSRTRSRSGSRSQNHSSRLHRSSNNYNGASNGHNSSRYRSRSPNNRHRSSRNTDYNNNSNNTNNINNSINSNQPDRYNPPENTVLAIFGLSKRANEQDLYDLFRPFNVKECKIIIDKRTGSPRGYGFAYFHKIRDASLARQKTEGKMILDRPIRVDFSIGERDFGHSSSTAKSQSSSSSSSSNPNMNGYYNRAANPSSRYADNHRDQRMPREPIGSNRQAPDRGYPPRSSRYASPSSRQQPASAGYYDSRANLSQNSSGFNGDDSRRRNVNNSPQLASSYHHDNYRNNYNNQFNRSRSRSHDRSRRQNYMQSNNGHQNDASPNNRRPNDLRYSLPYRR